MEPSKGKSPSPYIVNSPPYNPNTPSHDATPTPASTTSPWSECVVRAAIANNKLNGFTKTIESNPILAFMWESYTCALIGNKCTLRHIHILTEAQGHLKKAAKLLSTSPQYTDGIRKSLSKVSDQQARNFQFLKDNGLDEALMKLCHRHHQPDPIPPPEYVFKKHSGGLTSIEPIIRPITIKKPQLPLPNSEAAAIVAASTSQMATSQPSALAPPPRMTRFDNRLAAIQAAFDNTPDVVPTPTEYVMAPTTPVPTAVPDQMPSAFVPPPTTVLPVLPPCPQMNTQEFLELLIHSMAENATNIPHVERLALPDDLPAQPIGTR